jgi:tetrapyrrole methylase family protein / MazG family protein
MIERLLTEVERRTGRAPGEGLQIASPSSLLRLPFDPGLPLLIVADQPGADPPATQPRVSGQGDSVPFDPAVLPGRHGHGDRPEELLRALYPAGHPVLGLAGAADTTVESLAFGRSAAAAAYLVPALEGESNLASPHGLPWLAARLRAPDGCPWDRAQTHQSLRKHLLEETYEVYDALEAGATPELAGELGDLLLQVVLHAQHAAEAGVFDMSDVYRAIDAKIVRRHPHVFGSVNADSVDQVLRNWEQLKAAERAEAAAAGSAERARPETTTADDASTETTEESGDPEMPAAFAGLSRSLPALAYSQEMQERAASLGYDWPDVEGVIDKVEEEAVELLQAATPETREEEFGDLLLVLVNLGRKLGVDAEAALRAASRKFAARFAIAERLAAAEGRELRDMSFEELDELWARAKGERAARVPQSGPLHKKENR